MGASQLFTEVIFPPFLPFSYYFWLDATLSVLAFLSALGAFLILLYLRVTERKAPRITEPKHQAEISELQSALISIIVPARNEAEMLPRCVSSILGQTYRNLEVVIVDDNSSDETKKIAEEFALRDQRVRAISLGPKPRGWVGKSWPCQEGFEASRGELVLFFDADSWLESNALECAIDNFKSKNLDMYSISPKVELKGIWPHATVPLLTGGINLLYPLTKVNDPRKERAYVFGTFILVRRGVYESIGGHASVKDKLVEDAALAQRAKSRGKKLRVEIDGSLVRTDWESDFRSVYHGLERVFSDSVAPYGLVSILNAALVFFLGLYCTLYLIVFLVDLDLFASSSEVLLFGGVASVFNIAFILALSANELHIASRKVGWYPFLYPLGATLFVAAIVTASIKVSRSKGFEWKGGSYVQSLTEPAAESRV